MEIQDSSVSLQSSHQEWLSMQRKESLTLTRTASGHPVILGSEPSPEALHPAASKADTVRLSPNSKQASSAPKIHDSCGKSDAPMKDLNMRVLKIMVERVTGKKICILDMERVFSSAEAGQSLSKEKTLNWEAEAGGGWGLDYHSEQTYAEYESTTFKAEGQILTKDGMEIDFSLDLTMSREFVKREELNIQSGEAVKDPLVVNFAGSAAELTQTSFAFDIDCDGQDDQISCLKPGSGLLALDRNQDETINNGQELFGPSTGRGFAELAAFDEDGNDWIDAGDSIYDRLRIWTRDENGESRLFGLGEKGIGAICLDHAPTPFDLKAPGNQQFLGQVKTSGFFLDASGRPGTVQELDFKV